MKPKTIIVLKHEDGQDLLSFLAAHLKLSRKKSKQLLDSRGVFVNQKRVWMAHHTLRAGQEVSVVLPAGGANAPAAKIPILLETPGFLVVNKPAGVLANGSGSAEILLRRQRQDETLRAVHRLDRDTTGCLLVSRTDAVHKELVKIFARKEMQKSYHAIVVGKLDVVSRTVKRPLDGKMAITHLKTLHANSEASHLQVRIDTGRTHQIRQHLSDIYHPVLGDDRYGTRRRAGDRERLVRRQMLHASELSFREPGGEEMIRVRAPLPADFKSCLRAFALT
jgi:23S rRNA pseudouridine1911/1915/1917 synthase